MRRLAISTLLLVGCTDAAPPAPIAFHGEQAVLPGFAYDTGLLPAGSPVQLQLALAAGGAITADAEALGGGESIVPVAGSGRFAIDAHIKLEGTLKIDVSGLRYTGPIPGIENIDIAFGGETPFDPFLLGGSAKVSAELPEIQLPKIPLPGGLPGHIQLTVTAGSVINSELTGSCAGVDANMAQFKAKTSTTAHIVIAPTIVLMVPVLGERRYPIPNVAVDVPAIEAAMDLGALALDPKADAPDGEPVASASSCSGPGGGGGGGGTNGVCDIDDVSTWKATWHAPNAPYADVCTVSAITKFETACMAPGASVEECARFREQNAQCASCLMSSPDDATWGPTVGVELPTLQNTAGCVASTVSHGLSCAMTIQAYDECLDVACTSCDGRSSCKDTAANGVCAAYKDLAFSCKYSLGTEAAACFDEPRYRLDMACGSGI